MTHRHCRHCAHDRTRPDGSGLCAVTDEPSRVWASWQHVGSDGYPLGVRQPCPAWRERRESMPARR